MIREALPEDFDLIGRLIVTNWQNTYKGLLDNNFLDNLDPRQMSAQWAEYAKNKQNKVLVACVDNCFAGFVAAKPETQPQNYMYLDSLHVEEAFRGRGIGTALVKNVLDYAKQQGFDGCTICIVRGNDRAKNLYQKLGARHLEFFTDDFHGVPSQSQKLIWTFK